jgi:hypothetical protein
VKGITRGLFYGNIPGFAWKECGNVQRKELVAMIAVVDPFGIQTREQCMIGAMLARYLVKRLIPELVKISKAFMQGRWHALDRQGDTSVLKKYGKGDTQLHAF